MSCGISNTTISFLNVFYSCFTTIFDIFLLEHSTFKRAVFLFYACTDLKKSLELHSLQKGVLDHIILLIEFIDWENNKIMVLKAYV